MTDADATNVVRRSDEPEGRPPTTSDDILLSAQSSLALKAIELGISGNSNMLKLCLERISAINIKRSAISIPNIRTMDDVLEALSLIIQACARDEIPVSDGEALARLVGTTAAVLRDIDLTRRLEALEGKRRDD